MPASMDENPRERREVQSMADHAEHLTVQLDQMANGYGNGRSDNKRTALREASDAARTLKLKLDEAAK